MSSALSLSLFGLLVCAAFSFANPVGRMEDVTEVIEVTEDTAHPLQSLDEIIEDDYTMKQNRGIDEIIPDREEPLAEAWEVNNENRNMVVGDSEELGNEEVVEEDADNEHIMVKRDVEEEEEEDDVEVAEDDEHLEEEGEDEDEHEHEVEKRDVNEGLLEWYREAIDTKST